MTHEVLLNCTVVSPNCPVEDTIYGYYPSLGINAFFVAFFAISALLQVCLGLWYNIYVFSCVIAAGCVGEAVGYGGRILLHSNPYSSLGFKIQISCLVISPAIIAAGIYLTLKHIVLALGTEKSRIQARLYTWIFITSDILSLVLQAIGGGFAGGANGNVYLLNMGTDLIITGIVWQVVTLIVFGSLVVDYSVRTRCAWDRVHPRAKMLATKASFTFFTAGVAVAFWTIFCRCVYRIAEMSLGWANSIMRDQVGFVIGEGLYVSPSSLDTRLN